MRSLLILAFSLLAITDAYADWRGVKWGASIDEVKRKITDGLEPYKLNQKDREDFWILPYRTLLEQKIKIGSYGFVNYYLFDKEDRLQIVAMKALEYEDCKVFFNLLNQKYGTPKYTNLNDQSRLWNETSWESKTTNTMIVYRDYYSSSKCTATYEPINIIVDKEELNKL